jgi:hypothetical protein
MSAKDEVVEKKERLYVCDMCGPDDPVAQVFQCTVCLRSYCVKHIGTWIHPCYEKPE